MQGRSSATSGDHSGHAESTEAIMHWLDMTTMSILPREPLPGEVKHTRNVAQPSLLSVGILRDNSTKRLTVVAVLDSATVCSNHLSIADHYHSPLLQHVPVCIPDRHSSNSMVWTGLVVSCRHSC